jgi:hypothetical protein
LPGGIAALTHRSGLSRQADEESYKAERRSPDDAGV